MKLLVGKYFEPCDAHYVENENGSVFLCDVLVDGNLPYDKETVVGKTLIADSITPYLSLAHGVKEETK